MVPRIANGQDSTTGAATIASWNGDGYECCICSREFATLQNLNAHLVRHEPKDYRCAACDRRFVALAGVIMHWETTQCGHAVNRAAQELAEFRITL